MQNLNELKLSERISQLENAIKTHRSQKADDRCIEDDDRLYEVLGDGIKCDRRVGCKEDMLKNCQRFIENRCEGGGWPSYAQLEEKLQKALKLIKEYKHQLELDIKDELLFEEIGGLNNGRLFI